MLRQYIFKKHLEKAKKLRYTLLAQQNTQSQMKLTGKRLFARRRNNTLRFPRWEETVTQMGLWRIPKKKGAEGASA